MEDNIRVRVHSVVFDMWSSVLDSHDKLLLCPNQDAIILTSGLQRWHHSWCIHHWVTATSTSVTVYVPWSCCRHRFSLDGLGPTHFFTSIWMTTASLKEYSCLVSLSCHDGFKGHLSRVKTLLYYYKHEPNYNRPILQTIAVKMSQLLTVQVLTEHPVVPYSGLVWWCFQTYCHFG